jgi:hypothetical protein
VARYPRQESGDHPTEAERIEKTIRKRIGADRYVTAERFYCKHCGEYSIVVPTDAPRDSLVECRRCKRREKLTVVIADMSRHRLKPKPASI